MNCPADVSDALAMRAYIPSVGSADRRARGSSASMAQGEPNPWRSDADVINGVKLPLRNPHRPVAGFYPKGRDPTKHNPRVWTPISGAELRRCSGADCKKIQINH